ncbi:hypothetical protein [Neotabrizicola sp. sgz301269]|uniref:hypothetical protein n=1 Tax=Neotabrizicola sp. sgz301269 TaxID=3276282 RepID=UPI0037701FE5
MKPVAAALFFLPSAALAHTGDHHGAGLWHLLTEPDHLAMIAAVAAVLGLVIYRRVRS